MSTTFDHPDRLSVRCDARLKPMLAEVSRARRQPPGGVLEVLVEDEYERLRSLGRVSSAALGSSSLAQRSASTVRGGAEPAAVPVGAGLAAGEVLPEPSGLFVGRRSAQGQEGVG